MKRTLWILTGSVLIGLASLFAFVAYMLSSEGGLSWALQRAAQYVPGEFSVQTFQGTLRGPIVLNRVVWRNAGVTLEISRVELEWEPWQLLHGEVRILRLDLDTVRVQQAEATAPRPETVLKNFAAPLTISVRQGVVNSLSINAAPGQSAMQVERFDVAALWSGDVVQIERFEIQAPAFAAQMTGQITTRDLYPLTLQTAWTVRRPDQPELRGEGQLSGDLTRLQFAQQLLAPVKLNVNGAISDLLKTPQWELRAVAQGIDPKKIKTQWVFGALDLDVSAHSAGEVIESQGTVHTTHDVTGPFDIKWKGRYEKTRVTFDEIDAQLTGSAVRMRLRATAELDAQATYGIGSIAASGNWSTLHWPLRDAQQASSAKGEFSLSGTPEEYRFALAGPLRGENFPDSEIKLTGVGHAQDVKLQSIDVATLDGTLQGDAALQWGERLRWQAQLRGTRLNPGVRWSEWPGRLNLAANAEGEIRDGHSVAQVELTQLDGVLRGYPLWAQTRVTLNGTSFTVHQAEVRSGKSRWRAHGTVADNWTLDWDLDAPELAAIYPALSGTVSGSGTLRGPRATPHIQYAVHGREVRYQSVRVGQFDSRGDIDLNVKQPSTVSARATNIVAPGWRGNELQFNLDGALEAHRAVVTLRAPDSSVDISLNGRWRADAWTAQLERAAFTLPRFGYWTLDESVTLSASASAARWPKTCWRGAAGHLCTQGTWAPVDGVDAQVTLTESPLNALQSSLPEGIQLSGGLSASLHVVASPQQNKALRAELHAQLAPGKIVITDEIDEPLTFEHRGGGFNLLLDAQGVRADASVDFAKLGQVIATAQLPGWKPGTAPRDQPVTGSVRAEARELGILTRWLPTVEQIQGALKADVRVAGTLADPRFEGDVTLNNGAAALPQQGIKLSRINIEVHQRTEQRIEFHATASSGPGSLDLRGDVILDRAAGWPVTVEVSGKDFEAVNLPEVWVLASPELFVNKVRNRIDLGGVLNIPRARYTPRDVSGALAPSSDVVMVGSGEKTKKEEKWQIYTAVRFVFGDNVSFNGFGLKGLVRGEVVAMDEPKKLTTGYGELQMVDATFNAYKIDLSVTRGRLLFAGGPINNPGVDARAVREAGSIRQTAAKKEKGEALRESGAVIAGVLVRGRLRKLELTLFSEPPRDQADVLSLLLFGVPLGDATSEEGKALFIAASSLRLTGRDETLRKIGSRFGIDEIRLDAGNTPDQASLVIGRYLGPRLYINYSVGLISTGSNVLRVRYRISDKWMLQSEQSDAESAADLLYTFER